VDVVENLLAQAPPPLRSYVEELERQALGHVSDNRLGKSRAGVASQSRKAAWFNFPRSGAQRHEVLMAVHRAGLAGATSDEIAATHEIPLQSVKPRLVELREGGWVEQIGERVSLQGAPVGVFATTGKARRSIAMDLEARGQETRDLLSQEEGVLF
jgi:hypothetical protein